MNTIYIRLIRYFIGLIVLNCLAAALLFIITVGKPMAEDFHRLIRKQTLYIANITGEILTNDFSTDRLNHFLKNTSDSYEMDIVLFDHLRNPVAGHPGNAFHRVRITDDMVKQIEISNRFVQPGHFSKPTIYVLPVTTGQQNHYFLYIAKYQTYLKQYILLCFGLGVLCILLIVAIYPLAKSFTMPITRLSRALNQISRGDFKQEVNIENRKDELGDLLRVFQKMSRSVALMIESKKQLLADISHEIRSPLSRMRISAEMLKDDIRAQNSHRHIDNMVAEIDFMNEMIRSLAVFSKINLPSFNLYKKVVDPSTLVNEVYRRYADMASKNGFSLIKDTDGTPGSVKLDPDQIIRVLMNFMDNAVKYCNPGGKISLGLTEHMGKARFFVSDTGKGINDIYRDKIFAPLFRADPSRSRDTGGLGLGLAICKRIVELHGGEIFYNREKGKTVFSFIV